MLLNCGQIFLEQSQGIPDKGALGPQGALGAESPFFTGSAPFSNSVFLNLTIFGAPSPTVLLKILYVPTVSFCSRNIGSATRELRDQHRAGDKDDPLILSLPLFPCWFKIFFLLRLLSPTSMDTLESLHIL